MVIPALHSLHDLTVVGRCELNRGTANPNRHILIHVAVFAGLALLIGYIGFTGVPLVLTRYVSFRQEIFGPLVFYFVFSMFIHVHHYFLDYVIWRGENPETRAYLFAPR